MHCPLRAGAVFSDKRVTAALRPNADECFDVPYRVIPNGRFCIRVLVPLGDASPRPCPILADFVAEVGAIGALAGAES
jgi:hypothetical protein